MDSRRSAFISRATVSGLLLARPHNAPELGDGYGGTDTHGVHERRDGIDGFRVNCRRLDLTQREAEVARLLCMGESNKSISAALGIAESTARHHTQRVLTKLQVSSRGAVMHALRGLSTTFR